MTAGIGIAVLAALGCASSGASTKGPGQTGEFVEESIEGGGGAGAYAAAIKAGLKAVYFNYDEFTIRDDAKPVLRSNAQSIVDHTEWGVITVEGYCDERGSEEYNLALGERRANGVKRYLVDLGVPSSRLSTVSFGEAKPAVMGHDESAWRYNRRSEFTGGR